MAANRASITLLVVILGALLQQALHHLREGGYELEQGESEMGQGGSRRGWIQSQVQGQNLSPLF